MPMSLVRFNLIDPSLDAASISARYKAMLEMAAFADTNGFFMATFEEHHGAENAWSPTPLLNAGAVLSRTTNLAASVSALLLPLHDPIRVAEDIAENHPAHLVVGKLPIKSAHIEGERFMGTNGDR